MREVTVLILHPEPGAAAGALERWVATERRRSADRQRAGFLRAGASDARIVAGPPDDTPFGMRLRRLVRDASAGSGGVVVLGSGAAPLATARDRRAFVEAAARDEPRALANNRFSADLVAIPRAAQLAGLPDLPSDNALPRWLEEIAGYQVDDLRRSWRLALDIDGPLELVMLGAEPPVDIAMVRSRLAAVAAVAADRRAELLVAGRVSSATVGWLERGTAARTRILIEERGLRASSTLAQAGPRSRQRSPASVLGLLLDRDGPASLAEHVARLGDAAIIDSRVLLSHRFGSDERGWPPAGDRFASDLLLADHVSDPWLRELTASAATAPIPVVLGGHTLVGPGLRLLSRRMRWT